MVSLYNKKESLGQRDREAQSENDMKTHREKMNMWLEWCISLATKFIWIFQLLQKNMNKFCGQPNIYNPGNVKECLQTPNAGRGKEAPHLETSDKAWPYWHLDFRCLGSRTMRKWMSIVLATNCTLLCYISSTKLMYIHKQKTKMNHIYVYIYLYF